MRVRIASLIAVTALGVSACGTRATERGTHDTTTSGSSSSTTRSPQQSSVPPSTWPSAMTIAASSSTPSTPPTTTPHSGSSAHTAALTPPLQSTIATTAPSSLSTSPSATATVLPPTTLVATSLPPVGNAEEFAHYVSRLPAGGAVRRVPCHTRTGYVPRTASLLDRWRALQGLTRRTGPKKLAAQKCSRALRYQRSFECELTNVAPNRRERIPAPLTCRLRFGMAQSLLSIPKSRLRSSPNLRICFLSEAMLVFSTPI